MIAVALVAAAYGRACRQAIAVRTASPIFGKLINRSAASEQHTACGKEHGLTAHVERWNNTLRQRLARFVRKTLSFSKTEQMHELCLRLFIYRYNLSLLPT